MLATYRGFVYHQHTTRAVITTLHHPSWPRPDQAHT